MSIFKNLKTPFTLGPPLLRIATDPQASREKFSTELSSAWAAYGVYSSPVEFGSDRPWGVTPFRYGDINYVSNSRHSRCIELESIRGTRRATVSVLFKNQPMPSTRIVAIEWRASPNSFEPVCVEWSTRPASFFLPPEYSVVFLDYAGDSSAPPCVQTRDYLKAVADFEKMDDTAWLRSVLVGDGAGRIVAMNRGPVENIDGSKEQMVRALEHLGLSSDQDRTQRGFYFFKTTLPAEVLSRTCSLEEEEDFVTEVVDRCHDYESTCREVRALGGKQGGRDVIVRRLVDRFSKADSKAVAEIVGSDCVATAGHAMVTGNRQFLDACERKGRLERPMIMDGTTETISPEDFFREVSGAHAWACVCTERHISAVSKKCSTCDASHGDIKVKFGAAVLGDISEKQKRATA